MLKNKSVRLESQNIIVFLSPFENNSKALKKILKDLKIKFPVLSLISPQIKMNSFNISYIVKMNLI